ncbi:MAG TPA: DUF4235 domain-containing protein [Streptosporangiaceae bacterium]|nr:DUF4235 domain-containing protein [Streptosporangiaceae bacterium]
MSKSTAKKEPAKKADMGSRVANAVAGMAAAFVMRKVLTFTWTKVTGKEPPDTPEDPQVALGEALAWGVLMGAGVAAARLLASRLVAHKATGITEGTPPE